MEQKIVKLNMFKLIAIIVVVAGIAIAATMFVQGSYFKGDLIATKQLATQSGDISTTTTDAPATTDKSITSKTTTTTDAPATTDKSITSKTTTTTDAPVTTDKSITSKTTTTTDAPVTIKVTDFTAQSVSVDTATEVGKILNNYYSNLEEFKTNVVNFEKGIITKDIGQFKQDLGEIAKEYDPAALDKVVANFMAAIDKGESFETAFDTYFSKMTLSDNTKVSDAFEQLKVTFKEKVFKDLATKDFATEFDAIQKDFTTNLYSFMKKNPDLSGKDSSALNEYMRVVEELDSHMISSGVSSVFFDTQLPAYQDSLQIYSKDFGLKVI